MNMRIEKKVVTIITICMPVLTFIVCTNQTNSNNSGKTASYVSTIDSNTSISNDDAKFLITAAEICLKEINLGKLAQTHSNMSELKETGKVMNAYYTDVLHQLKNLATNKSVSLPAGMDSDGKDAYERLMVKNGSDFDEQYSDIVVRTDKYAIDLFVKELQSTQNNDITRFVASQLPTLKTQLANAEADLEKCKK